MGNHARARRMTDAVASVDGAAGLDGAPAAGVSAAVDGLDGVSEIVATERYPSARAIAEAVHAAMDMPAEEGTRLLLELAIAPGPWSSAAVARRLPTGTWGTWTGSSALAQLCDRVQWDIGAGPARDALTGDLVTVTRLIGDPRWPAWAEQVAALGARSAAAVRLPASRPLGVLSVYGSEPADPDRPAIEHLRTMAAHLSVLLEAVDRRENLERGMVNRGVIGQAIGVLVERYGITVDQAFATLRRVSQNENVKLARLAADLMRTGDLPGLHRPGG